MDTIGGALEFPILVLLRELLSEYGSIWVTIDDNEGHYLKVVMDELFGRRNSLGAIWLSNALRRLLQPESASSVHTNTVNISIIC